MKKILCGTVAALAIVGMASPAAAQRTDTRHYAGTIQGYNITASDPNPFAAAFADGLLAAQQLLLDNDVIDNGFGTRYTAKATAGDDSVPATDTVTVSFAMHGEVNRDCSFYSGNDTGNVRNIELGVIGVKTGNNENVSQAFEMTDDVEVNIQTLTAGCNFNNRVEIEKDDIRGLVNRAAGSYDTDQFRANIPYSVTAEWTGVERGTRATGTDQQLVVGDNDKRKHKLQGAWRSQMDINITAAALTDKGLVAGDYEGTTTLTLSAS